MMAVCRKVGDRLRIGQMARIFACDIRDHCHRRYPDDMFHLWTNLFTWAFFLLSLSRLRRGQVGEQSLSCSRRLRELWQAWRGGPWQRSHNRVRLERIRGRDRNY
jgi:hypothetical protein